jgi:hypothetical protein
LEFDADFRRLFLFSLSRQQAAGSRQQAAGSSQDSQVIYSFIMIPAPTARPCAIVSLFQRQQKERFAR